MMNKRLRATRVRLTFLALAATACGGGPDGADAGPGVSGDTITVGAIVPLSDAVAVIGIPIAGGLATYFERLNAERGGIAGRYAVRLLTEDQTYANPSTTVQKYTKIKDQVALFATILGTDHIKNVLPLLAEDNMIAGPTTFDAEWVRERHLLPFGTPYQIMAINGAAHYVATQGRDKKLCSMVLSTGYGAAYEEGAEFVTKELGLTLAARARFKQDDQDFVAPITQLRTAGCDAVLIASLPGVTGRILGAAAQLGYAPTWIGTFPSWGVALAESPLKDYLVKNLWIVWDGPSWGDTTSVAMSELRAAQAKYRPDQKPDPYFVGGWILANAMHQLLEKAVALGDLSRQGIMNASDSLGTVSVGGLIGDYRYGPAGTREPPRASTIFRIDPGVPTGLATLQSGVLSDAAKKYQFVKGGN
jgi:ABC-type branched-subunit amino acid transport system substrate-binding protein